MVTLIVGGSKDIGDEGSKALARIIGNIPRALLSDIGMGEEGFQAIAQAVFTPGSKTKCLDVAFNRITDASMDILMDIVHTNLPFMDPTKERMYLDLRCNHITDTSREFPKDLLYLDVYSSSWNLYNQPAESNQT